MKARSWGCVLALVAAPVVHAELFRCPQPQGGVRFTDLPCNVGEAAPLPPAAVVEKPVSVPPNIAVAPPAAAAPEASFVPPTKRKRDVLDVSAQFERCRADVPGFAEKSAAIYAAWTRRHAAVLSGYDRLLAAKVRAGRHGEATLPLRQCNDDWLRAIEPLTRLPDPRFNSAEKTWQVFLGALLTADRSTALACLAGEAEVRWKERVARMSDEELRRVAASIRGMKVQWGDDYEKEGLVADTANRVVGIAFRSINEEWKIADFGAAAPAPAPAQ